MRNLFIESINLIYIYEFKQIKERILLVVKCFKTVDQYETNFLGTL